jgi:hypothetical protein
LGFLSLIGQSPNQVHVFLLAVDDGISHSGTRR